MNDEQALTVSNQIFKNIFGVDSPFRSLERIKEVFAFDVRLPIAVKDSTTGETTYTAMVNSEKFITVANAENWNHGNGWMQTGPKPKTLSELIDQWQKVNYTTTERVYNSENVAKSDPIYDSTNIYNSTDCSEDTNMIFCDGCHRSENCLACQRSITIENCIRVDDSGDCTNSYIVACSKKISNSLFIQDANSLHECIFCSHVSNLEYCIANMQFEKTEYFALKAEIIKWIIKNLQ